MADYFLVLDGAAFEGRVRPALAASWRRRTFDPCRSLCADLVPAARAYAERYHTGSEEPLVSHVAHGLPFDRAYWRTLVGEVLLFTAVDIPEVRTCPETLCRLLAPEHDRLVGQAAGALPREQLPPILQAHQGSRDLTFGRATYRPEHAGYNDAADSARLADYLESVDPARWAVADLQGLPGAQDEEELAEELALARDWFPPLRELYRQAGERGRVLVLEDIY